MGDRLTCVKADVIRHFLSINKLELLPWGGNALIEKPVKEMTPEELALIDRLADLTGDIKKNFAEIRSLYEANPAFRMPPDWQP